MKDNLLYIRMMNAGTLKLLFCIMGLILFHQSSSAQHYLFIESEGQQPFYLKTADKVYSSNGSGFLLLSKVTDSVLSVKIGFPGNTIPESTFVISGTDHDRGFLMRKSEGQGWILIDRVSMEKLYAGNSASGNIRNDATTAPPFVKALSEAVGDSNLLQSSSLTKPETTEKTSTTRGNSKTKDASQQILYVISEDSDKSLKLYYIDRMSRTRLDTIYVEIPRQQP